MWLGVGLWVDWSSVLIIFVSYKQNEENKKKNKQAALKAQMDLEEARKAAEQQKNSASPRDQGGESF